MTTKFSVFFAFIASICFLFVSADIVIAQDDCDDYWSSACANYNRPTPLMDYVPQERGIYDTSYRELREADCRGCHGSSMAERHHATDWVVIYNDCLHCHEMCEPPECDPPEPVVITDCATPGCHSWDDVATNGWHHLSDESASVNCVACHDPTLIGAFGPGTSLLDDPPTVSLPTPYSCQNCHWQQQVEMGTDSPKDILGVNLTNPCEVVVVDHHYSTGNVIHISGIQGTTQLNGQFYTITVLTSHLVALDGVDATSFGSYVGGGKTMRYTGANEGHPSDFNHLDPFGVPAGFYEYPAPIVHLATSHMKEHTSNITPTCGRCHSLTGTDPNNPGDPSWSHTNPELIRYCQRCHTKETLHTIHQQGYNAWEAVGFHTSGDPNGVPDTYRSFTASEMCDGCHVPPIITQVSPNEQEPTIYRSYEAAYLSTALGYTITAPRWGRVRIYGNNFGTEQIGGDQVRIGDPRAAAPTELQYDTNSDPYTVETITGGVSLYIGPWNDNNNNMIGVYLYPEPGQYLYALYGPNVGLHWLDTWLAIWVVKFNGGGPVASNVQPIKVLTPLPD